MVTVTIGARVVLDLIDGNFSGRKGKLESLDESLLAIRLDDDQPPTPVAPLVRVEFSIEADTGFTRMKTHVYDTQSVGRRIRVVKPDNLVRRERRASERIALDKPLLWSQLNQDGQLTEQRHGIARDVSLGGMRFETVSRPPKLRSIVAVSSTGTAERSLVLVCVVGVDDVPAEVLHHAVRCSMDLSLATTAAMGGGSRRDKAAVLPDLFESDSRN